MNFDVHESCDHTRIGTFHQRKKERGQSIGIRYRHSAEGMQAPKR